MHRCLVALGAIKLDRLLFSSARLPDRLRFIPRHARRRRRRLDAMIARSCRRAPAACSRSSRSRSSACATRKRRTTRSSASPTRTRTGRTPSGSTPPDDAARRELAVLLAIYKPTSGRSSRSTREARHEGSARALAVRRCGDVGRVRRWGGRRDDEGGGGRGHRDTACANGLHPSMVNVSVPTRPERTERSVRARRRPALFRPQLRVRTRVAADARAAPARRSAVGRAGRSRSAASTATACPCAERRELSLHTPSAPRRAHAARRSRTASAMTTSGSAAVDLLPALAPLGVLARHAEHVEAAGVLDQLRRPVAGDVDGIEPLERGDARAARRSRTASRTRVDPRVRRPATSATPASRRYGRVGERPHVAEHLAERARVKRDHPVRPVPRAPLGDGVHVLEQRPRTRRTAPA